jgi:hypothetical protein
MTRWPAVLSYLVLVLVGCTGPAAPDPQPEPLRLTQLPSRYTAEGHGDVAAEGWLVWAWSTSGERGDPFVGRTLQVRVLPLADSEEPFWAGFYLVYGTGAAITLDAGFGRQGLIHGMAGYRNSTDHGRGYLWAFNDGIAAAPRIISAVAFSERPARIEFSISVGEGERANLTALVQGDGLEVTTLPLSSPAEAAGVGPRAVTAADPESPGGLTAVWMFTDSVPPYRPTETGTMAARFPDGREERIDLLSSLGGEDHTAACSSLLLDPATSAVCRVSPRIQLNLWNLARPCQPPGEWEATAVHGATSSGRVIPVLISVPVDVCQLLSAYSVAPDAR